MEGSNTQPLKEKQPSFPLRQLNTSVNRYIVLLSSPILGKGKIVLLSSKQIHQLCPFRKHEL